jgi:hypothetical protein
LFIFEASAAFSFGLFDLCRFVHMEDEGAAQAALQSLNGMVVKGRNIKAL